MTRSPLLFRLTVACWLAGPTSALWAQQTPPPVDAKAVLAALKDLRTKQTGIITKEKAGVLAALNAAIADPAKTYEQALAAVGQPGAGSNEATPRPAGPRFAGNSDANRAAEERKRINDQMRDRDFVNGLRLQLVYLSLTWQHSMGVKTKELIPALLDYAAQVNNGGDTLLALDMARKPLGDSVFVHYFQVGPYIAGLADWSDQPFDTEAIFQKTILPELRKEKDPRLFGYWDGRLQAEAARARATGNNLIVAKFDHIRRPSLLWSRAEDEQVVGNGNQAVADMLAILKANPDHPDFDKWAAELEGMVSAKPDAAPASEVTVGPATYATPLSGDAPAAAPGAR